MDTNEGQQPLGIRAVIPNCTIIIMPYAAMGPDPIIQKYVSSTEMEM